MTGDPFGRHTEYEKMQGFNAITSWLHSFRYKKLESALLRYAMSTKRPIRILEIGCAHANLFGRLRELKFEFEYLGVDHNREFIDVSTDRYGEDRRFTAIYDCATKVLRDIGDGVDVIVALETLEHMPRPKVIDVMESISRSSVKICFFSVPIEIGPSIWIKNIGSIAMGYVRHREYTWMETFWAGLCRLDKLPAHKNRHKGFDWRWLRGVIAQYLEIDKVGPMPFEWLPTSIAPSVFFVAKK